MLHKYDKQPVLAMSAYNASPRAASRWLKNLPKNDWLVFSEFIPYKETNLYVKLVLRNYFYYKKWYSDSNQSTDILDQVFAKRNSSDQIAPIAKKVSH